MASLAARRLTEAHRLTQVRLGAQTVQRLRAVWPMLDPNKLDATFQRWLVAALPIIEAQRATSTRLASAYLTTFKTIETGGGPRVPIVKSGSASLEAVTTSLLVTGPLSIKNAMSRGVDLSRAVDIAEAASSASGMRYALDGGRETILETVRADPEAKGFVRVASGNACNFCEDLAGQELPDDEAFQAHDGCSCTSEPVYR